MDTIEKLESLREERLARMAANNSHIESLQDENQRLDGEIRGLDLAIKLCTSAITETALSPVTAANGSPALIGKYANAKLTDAVFDVIQTGGNPPGLLPSEITRVLKLEGFQSTAKDVYASAYSIAQRLVEQGKVREGRKDGKRTFMRK